MSFSNIEEGCGKLVTPLLNELGLELVDVEFKTESGRKILRVFIDKPEGVNVDDLSKVSRELGTLLDVEDLIGERYSLEVSSPGLDRPLKKKKDFETYAGRKINLKTKEAVNGRKNFKVVIKEVSEDEVIVSDSEGTDWTIEFANIEKARLEIEI